VFYDQNDKIYMKSYENFEINTFSICRAYLRFFGVQYSSYLT